MRRRDRVALPSRLHVPVARPTRTRVGLALLTALALLPGPAGAQTADAERFAQSAGLAPGTYEAVTAAPLGGVPVPAGAVRFRTLGGVNAETLKRAFTTDPALFGLRCTDQELVAFPSGDRAIAGLLAQALRVPGTVPLADRPQAAAWRRGDVFSVAFQGRGMVLYASCRTVRDVSTTAFLTSRRDFHVGSVPTAVMADALGRVAWCGPQGPVRQRDVFTGSATTLVTARDGRTVAVGGWDAKPSVKILDRQTGETRRTLPLARGAVATALDGTGAAVVVLDAAGLFTVYDVATGRVLSTWDERSPTPFEVQGGGDAVFTTVQLSAPIKIMDGRTGRVLRSLYSVGVDDHALTPDGQWAVTVGREGVLRAYRVKTTQRGLTRRADASVSVGALTGASLMPGRAPDEVVALLPRRAADGRVSFEARAWRVGTATTEALPDAQVRVGEAETLETGARRLSSVPPCIAATYR